MSKQNKLIMRLAAAGWYVTKEGAVVKPSGEIRASSIKEGKEGRPSYKVFNVKDEGISRPVHVHKLAAFLKFGEVVFEYQVRHLNGNSFDNSYGNIAFGTGSDNMMDRSSEDRKAHGLKAAKFLRKLTYEDVRYIRESVETGLALAERFRVAPSTISGVKNRKLYRSI